MYQPPISCNTTHPAPPTIEPGNTVRHEMSRFVSTLNVTANNTVVATNDSAAPTTVAAGPSRALNVPADPTEVKRYYRARLLD